MGPHPSLFGKQIAEVQKEISDNPSPSKDQAQKFNQLFQNQRREHEREKRKLVGWDGASLEKHNSS